MFIAVISAFSSCKKQLDTNLTNPNGVTIGTLSGKDVFAQALLATVTNKIGANTATGTDNYDYAAEWMQYYARNSGWAAAGQQAYIEAFYWLTAFSNGIWQSLYHNIYDYAFVVSHSPANSILPGASKVMQAMVFQDLVDQFGNVPYFQAAKDTQYQRPAYDSATIIYTNLIVQLDSAIALIQASQPSSDDVAADIMFGGNKTKWIQFANTIKLRILLRQVPNVTSNTAYVQTEIGKIVSQGGGFLGAGTDATIQPGFSDASTRQNPFWGVYGFEPGGTTPYQNYNFFCANSFMITTLQSINDPRVGYFYAATAGQYVGEVLGNNNNLGTSPFGQGLLQSATMPALLFSASQSFFMQAEVASRFPGLIPGSVSTLYQQGVEESFRYLKVPNYKNAADTYISTSTSDSVNINITPAANQLQTILYQKWIAECGLDGLEAWSDWRRTGIPNLNNIIAPDNYPVGLQIPLQILYPQSEYSLNSANVNAQTTNGLSIPPFWGK